MDKLFRGIKKFLRWIIDISLIKIVRYVIARNRCWLIDELQHRAVMESADYVAANMPDAIAFTSRAELRDFAVGKISLDGTMAEFGVKRGDSINYIAAKLAKSHPTAIIHGFDSFEGLREDWKGHSLAKGAFDCGGKLPSVRNNVRLVKGWFNKTLPPFLEQNTGIFSFIHLDSDTYESAETVFNLIGERIIPGTIILFDEYFGYRGWKAGEFKAWQDFVKNRKIKYEYLGFSEQQVCVKVLEINPA